jgi:hypothetical protein
VTDWSMGGHTPGSRSVPRVTYWSMGGRAAALAAAAPARSRVRNGDSQPNSAATSPTDTTDTSAGRSPMAPASALAMSAPPVQPTPNDNIRPAVLTLPSMASGVTCCR